MTPGAAPGAASARLFHALWPDAPARAAVEAWRASWCWPPGVVLVEPPRLHLTLHFIGSVPNERIAEISRGLDRPCPRFEITFGAAELWPRGIAVLTPLALPPELLALHAALGERLAALGLALEDRPYRPHVTLARKAAAAQAPDAPALLRWPVGGYALVRSAGGYERLAEYG